MSAAGVILLIVVIVIAFGAYWAPTIVGWRRHVPNLGSIIVLNFLLGWTLVGWAVALAMSVKTIAPPVTLMQAQGWAQPPPGYPPYGPPQPQPYGPPQPYSPTQGYGPTQAYGSPEEPQRAQWPEQPPS
jgi:Superinfection immunity protein